MATAVITGAAPGNIGGAAADKLAQAGYGLVLVDKAGDPAALAAELAARHGVTGTGWPLDVSDSAAVAATLTAVFERFAAPTVLVNAAGIAHPQPPDQITAADFDRVLAVNLQGTFLCCQGFCNRLVAAGRGGAVVNLASMAAYSGGRTNGVDYAASKAGIISLTKGMAHHYGASGIRINAVAPGIIETPMARAIPGSQSRVEASALKRWGTVDEVADVIAFLCSAGAAYVAGTTVDITGGTP